MKLVGSLLALFLFLATTTTAQKKQLTPDDYGKWQTLSLADISPNGEWIAYIVASQEENDTLYVKNRVTNKLYKLEFATNFELSKDNQYIAWQIGVSYKEAEKLRDQKLPIRYKMGLLNLATGKKEIIQDVNAFRGRKPGATQRKQRQRRRTVTEETGRQQHPYHWQRDRLCLQQEERLPGLHCRVG
jgi:hypothetical protein